jgi:outer membrane protein assembly factor BamB
MSVSVYTRSFNNYREGANLQETILTPARVKAKGISHLFDCVMADDLRGSEGMPLVVSGLTMRDGLVHNVLFQATMANDVYAFDADTGALLWKQHVGNPIPGTVAMDMYLINDHWGILSTPVINPITNTIYVVAMTSPTAQLSNSSYVLHALSLFDGSEQATPLNLNNATYQPPNGIKQQVMGSVPRKQRCGLLFDSRNGIDTVFVANGSFNEDADTNRGWIIACDVTNLKLSLAAAWTTTSRYSGGGLWMGGQGLGMNEAGHLLSMTGNGAFDGITDFGESFFRVQYTPKTATTAASLKILDWFTPFTDTGRVAGPYATVADTSLLPASAQGDTPGGTSNMDSPGDEDLNSGGPLYLPMSITGYSKNVIVGAGKDGILYVVNADNMGKPALASFAPNLIQTNVYDLLLSPPYGFTYYPGNMNLTPTDLSTLQTTYGGYTHHQHSTPVFYKSPTYGPMLLTGGENGPVRAFKFNADFTLTYLGCGAEIASAHCGPPGGMPGTMMTLSANGTVANTAILWCLMPYGDANKMVDLLPMLPINL